MEYSSVVAACLVTVLYLISFSVAQKSHSIMVTRVEGLTADDNWIRNAKTEIKKIDKNSKSFGMSFGLKKQLVDETVMIEMKMFQQSGGKYVKAPLDFPKQPLCKFLETNEIFWPCVQSHSNIKERCPIPEGDYWIKDLNPNNCNFGHTMPPNLPENYKGDLNFMVGHKSVLKMTVYGKLKRNMMII